MPSFDLKNNLPTFDGDKNKTDYRVMSSKVEHDSFSTVVLEDDKSKTTLRTKGGNHQITVEKTDTVEVINYLEEKDYALREYFDATRSGQITRDIKKIILKDGNTPITFEPIPSPIAENDWYRFEILKTVDGLFDVVVPVAKKAKYGFAGNQIDIEFVRVESFYTETDKIVISESGLSFVCRTPIKIVAVKLSGNNRKILLKEPISLVDPIQAY